MDSSNSNFPTNQFTIAFWNLLKRYGNLYYDGAVNDKELIITNRAPIPFVVDILIQDGDAQEIIKIDLLDWLPVIQQLGIVVADDCETKALYTILLDADSNAE